ncbi:hypothetical protein Vretifemale_4839, partial [Volvox reticuliferus]
EVVVGSMSVTGSVVTPAPTVLTVVVATPGSVVTPAPTVLTVGVVTPGSVVTPAPTVLTVGVVTPASMVLTVGAALKAARGSKVVTMAARSPGEAAACSKALEA